MRRYRRCGGGQRRANGRHRDHTAALGDPGRRPQPLRRRVGAFQPGASIGRYGISAPGDAIVSLAAAGGFAAFSETSAAVPFVSGTAALLWSLFPRASAAELRLALTAGDRSSRRCWMPEPPWRPCTDRRNRKRRTMVHGVAVNGPNNAGAQAAAARG